MKITSSKIAIQVDFPLTLTIVEYGWTDSNLFVRVNVKNLASVSYLFDLIFQIKDWSGVVVIPPIFREKFISPNSEFTERLEVILPKQGYTVEVYAWTKDYRPLAQPTSISFIP